jgi:hypothetical protein
MNKKILNHIQAFYKTIYKILWTDWQLYPYSPIALICYSYLVTIPHINRQLADCSLKLMQIRITNWPNLYIYITGAIKPFAYIDGDTKLAMLSYSLMVLSLIILPILRALPYFLGCGNQSTYGL